ncbi:MAG: NUDIX domain-containing protein [Casimicrobium sp.]
MTIESPHPLNTERIRIINEETLAKDWHTLKKMTFDYRRNNGQWQRQSRETYDRGNGATILLYNLARRTVVLIRQFRLPTFVNDYHGFLIETPAGLLENASPEVRIKAEVEEETGFQIADVQPIFSAFMSPGSVTERVYFFIGRYEAKLRVSEGGGLENEGEDIEVLEPTIDVALAMIASGEICDGKTIMLLQYAALHIFSSAGQ